MAVALSGAWYLWWRRQTLSGVGPFGFVFITAEVITYAFLLVTAALLLRTRRRLDGPDHPPAGTLDVFVTVCGEPIEMVERTVRAALAISYPHQTYLLNDGLIAQHPRWFEVDELAERLNVPCFTRMDGAKGKAGNLNHALTRTEGEFVATIDADHIARREFAHETVGYFREATVGFVCTLQRFETEGPDVLNNAEPIFYHGLQPAKDADDCAFSCGNGTVYRRSALEAVGGFSEWNLVEDLHTSYRLHAHGWKSVYHPRAVTVGVAPRTAAVYLKQRIRWAMDSLRLLLFDNPLKHPELTWRQRVHYLHTTSVYLFASLQVTFLAAPSLYIFRHTWVMNPPSNKGYMLHSSFYVGSVLVFLVLTCGLAAAFRTMQGALFSGSVYFLALVRTLVGLLPSTDPTEKGRQPSFSMLMALPMVSLGLLLAAVGVGTLGASREASSIAVYWAAFQAFLLVGPLSTISERRLIASIVRITGRGAVIAALISMVILGLRG